ncbi:DUF3081 domain-containing protein [Photobacterium sanguinicancri]|uniref:DUF3081 domain-containing protein n=1 Tax=Photobacterium sanguinicancri TaxID=875932 RepID=A0AAW7Y6L2_9GAMM|nr:DUF3081 domain-containing protein [Photobacterium sanguinicancri]MDO6544027.1 DUF3081 domain-containing protein [Photobacterium sanguinicancri]
MDNRLTIREFLRVFDCIRSNGDKLEHKYQWGEIDAWHDYDGYTCWLRYKDVTVTLMFHGSLKVEYDKASNYSDFIEQCLSLTDNAPDCKRVST